MSKIKDSLETRCELALMGKVQEVQNQEEVQKIFEYVKSACGKERYYNDIDIIKDRICKYTKNEVKYFVTYRLYDMPCICFLLANADEDEENNYPAPFEESYGTPYQCAFCYVFNLADDDMCSEFGDVFFKKMSDGFYHLAH